MTPRRPTRTDARRAPARPRPAHRGLVGRRGFSLVEMLIVVLLMGVIAAAIVPYAEPQVDDAIMSLAEVLAADLAHARQLAVANQSEYRVAFDVDANAYVITHSGADDSLDTLPPSPFRRPGDPSDQLTVRVDDLPFSATGLELIGATMLTPTPTRVADVEFGRLGETTRSEPTVVWVGAREGRRLVSLTIDPVTGLVGIGEVVTRASLPAALK